MAKKIIWKAKENVTALFDGISITIRTIEKDTALTDEEVGGIRGGAEILEKFFYSEEEKEKEIEKVEEEKEMVTKNKKSKKR